MHAIGSHFQCTNLRTSRPEQDKDQLDSISDPSSDAMILILQAHDPLFTRLVLSVRWNIPPRAMQPAKPSNRVTRSARLFTSIIRVSWDFLPLLLCLAYPVFFHAVRSQSYLVFCMSWLSTIWATDLVLGFPLVPSARSLGHRETDGLSTLPVSGRWMSLGTVVAFNIC